MHDTAQIAVEECSERGIEDGQVERRLPQPRFQCRQAAGVAQRPTASILNLESAAVNNPKDIFAIA